MKKILISMLILLNAVILYGCQKKEDATPQYRFPVGQGQIPTGPIQAVDEVKLLKETLSKDPKNLNAWIKLGNIFMDTSRYNEAIEAYQKALELDPKNVDVRVDMGTCYRYAGRSDLAVKEYRKALEYNPRHINGHKNLGVVLAYDLKDNIQAVKEFEKALELDPNAHDAPQIRQLVQELKSTLK